MAEERERKEYRWCGPESQPQRVSSHSAPLAPDNAVQVLRKTWKDGRYHISMHFKKRCGERGIDMVDVENVISAGTLRGTPEYSEEYRNWKYRLCGVVDDRLIEVAIALDPAEDFSGSPLAIFLSAYERKPSP